MEITYHLLAYGRVQGVFFRESMCAEATKLRITGWVRNRLDGALEAVLQGEVEQVERLVAWARRGPRGAYVERLEVTPGEGEYTEFSRLPSA
jgi:acylphosphatase